MSVDTSHERTRERPRSVVNSLRVLALIVVTSGVITVLTYLQRDEVILGWMEGNPSAREIYDQGGIAALRESPIVPGFVALAVVAFIGFVLLAMVLASFFAGGHRWTRPVLTATAFIGVLVGAVCLDKHLPTVFVVLSAVIIVEGLALVFFLYRKDTTAHLRD
jgi:hypothetical protein